MIQALAFKACLRVRTALRSRLSSQSICVGHLRFHKPPWPGAGVHFLFLKAGLTVWFLCFGFQWGLFLSFLFCDF